MGGAEAMKFGDPIENVWASPDNPTKYGFFVRTIKRLGRVMNAGMWVEMTDGNGEFWEVNPEAIRLTTVLQVKMIPCSVPPYPKADEPGGIGWATTMRVFDADIDNDIYQKETPKR